MRSACSLVFQCIIHKPCPGHSQPLIRLSALCTQARLHVCSTLASAALRHRSSLTPPAKYEGVVIYLPVHLGLLFGKKKLCLKTGKINKRKPASPKREKGSHPHAKQRDRNIKANCYSKMSDSLQTGNKAP